MSVHSALLANKLSRLFDPQGIEALCSHYTYPLPVQADGAMHVLETPRDLLRAFTRFCSKRAAQGLTNPTARIAAIELPRNGRFRIWLDWTFTETATGQAVQQRTIYYCTLIGHRTAIDMIACNPGVAKGPASVALQRRSA